MCGITGFIGEYNDEEIYKSNNFQKHRGPDGKSTIFRNKYGVSFRRLAIIDQKNGQQPFYNKKRKSLIFVNGEIYNGENLLKTLPNKNFRLSSNSDIEPLIHLYDYYGISFLENINGTFAGCLLDEEANKGYIFRDRFGVKPFYYGLDNNRFIFSSEIQPIRASIYKNSNYSVNGLSSYLNYRFVKAPNTFFNNIYELLPGEVISIDLTTGKILNKRFFINIKKELSLQHKNMNNINEKEALDLLDFNLKKAVKRQTNLKNKKGIFLSGGIDSSILAKLIAENTNEKIYTYTLNDKTAGKNNADLALSRVIAKQINSDHTEVEISPNIWFEEKEKTISSFGQPFGHAYSTYFVSKEMKDDLKVAYSGDGSDEIFGNYLSHRFASSLDRYIHSKKINETLLDQDQNKDKMFKKIMGKGKNWRYFLYNFTENKFKGFFDGFNQSNLLSDYNLSHTNNAIADNFNQILIYEINNELPNQILKFTDNLSMINSIETRVPFLDNDLVNFAFSLPNSLKINHLTNKHYQTKYLLKLLSKRYLDNIFINRKPQGFQLNTNNWMRDFLKESIISVLNDKILYESFGINKKKCLKIAKDFFNNDNKYIYELWTLYILGLWASIDKSN